LIHAANISKAGDLYIKGEELLKYEFAILSERAKTDTLK